MTLRAEERFDIEFISPLALAEKQIQQAYRPYIQTHKWFARRPGSLFRALLLAEFGENKPISELFFSSNEIMDATIYDPFMGGGTPLLEANRLGLNTIGNDINPMATWLVLQTMADLDLTTFDKAAVRVLQEAERRLQRYYQTVCRSCGQHAPVKYFIWVKTIKCGGCKEKVELFPGFRIAKNSRHPNVVSFCPICRDLFETEKQPVTGENVVCTSCESEFKYAGLAKRSTYSCSSCGHFGRYATGDETSPPRHSLIAIEYHCPCCKPAHKGRFFKAPDNRDFQLIDEAFSEFASADNVGLIPEDLIPAGDETSRLHKWGYEKYSDLFNSRQLLGLITLMQAIKAEPNKIIRHALATVFSDFLRYQNMLARYDTYALKCQDIFSIHGYPVGLIQCENNIIGIPHVGSGGYRHFIRKFRAAKEYCQRPWEKKLQGRSKQKIMIKGEKIAAKLLDSQPDGTGTRFAYIKCQSSTETKLRRHSIDAVITDPPYFDNVQYAELIDFCYVWLRRLVGDDIDYFSEPSTRTANELTGNKTAGRDLSHFTEGISSVFRNAAYALRPGGLFAFTYHHNSVDAYLPLVVALSDARLIATASLPCPAEMSASLHIAGTSSSVIDTILCARSEVEVKQITDSEIGELLTHQINLLRASGVDVSQGDARCMALGLLTVSTINALHCTWDNTLPINERIMKADENLKLRLSRLGGLEGVVHHAFAAAEEYVQDPQLELFNS